MINQIRTLLLNQAPPAYPGPGDEYVPAGYAPAPLPPDLDAFRNALFGDGHDAYGRSVTLARVLTAADANPDLYAAVRADDPRVTYSSPYPPVPADTVYGTAAATLLRPPRPFLSAGRGNGAWAVTVANGTASILFDGSATTPPVSPGPTAGTVAATQAVVVAEADGSPWLADRPPAGRVMFRVAAGTQPNTYTVPLPGSVATLVVPVAGGSWAVQVWDRPAYNWTAVAARADAASLFTGTAPADLAAAAVWRAGPAAYDRAAAFAVALARRIRDNRLSQGLPT